MKRFLAACFLTALLSPAATVSADSPKPLDHHPVWVTGYYPIWEQTGGMSPDEIDYSAITHLVHFAIVPRADGTIEDAVHGTLGAITPAQSKAVVTDAHRHGVKALVCLGGANTEPVIGPVLAAAPLRSAFVKSLVAFVADRGYDGLDVDMEPINPSDEANFIAFVRELRAAMKARNAGWLLTIPASGTQERLCALLKDDFDQINIQTYDQSGTWDGFKTWYNGSLYGDGPTLMTATRPYPSVDEKVGLYLAAGVPRAKLGIGVAFYGYVWKGADGPTQSIQGVTADPLAYNAIMDQYSGSALYHWDRTAAAPYLSVEAAQATDRKFISYDDARLAYAKVVYARTHNLGGVIIWELGDDYRAGQPAGQKDVLLQAIKRAVQGLPATEPIVAAR